MFQNLITIITNLIRKIDDHHQTEDKGLILEFFASRNSDTLEVFVQRLSIITFIFCTSSLMSLRVCCIIAVSVSSRESFLKDNSNKLKNRVKLSERVFKCFKTFGVNKFGLELFSMNNSSSLSEHALDVLDGKQANVSRLLPSLTPFLPCNGVPFFQ